MLNLLVSKDKCTMESIGFPSVRFFCHFYVAILWIGFLCCWVLGITRKDKVRNEERHQKSDETSKSGPHHQGKKIEMAGTCVAHER